MSSNGRLPPQLHGLLNSGPTRWWCPLYNSDMAQNNGIGINSLENISDWLRRDIVSDRFDEAMNCSHQIVVSGGWLADIVPLLSDALRIWDIFILSALFIASWVILRISDPLTSLILGLTFDATIPLQHLCGILHINRRGCADAQSTRT